MPELSATDIYRAWLYSISQEAPGRQTDYPPFEELPAIERKLYGWMAAYINCWIKDRQKDMSVLSLPQSVEYRRYSTLHKVDGGSNPLWKEMFDGELLMSNGGLQEVLK